MAADQWVVVAVVVVVGVDCGGVMAVVVACVVVVVVVDVVVDVVMGAAEEIGLGWGGEDLLLRTFKISLLDKTV